MSQIVQSAIDAVNKAEHAFCKFISANDAGVTGAHQSGFYMPKNTIPLMFDKPQERGTQTKKPIEILWQDDFTTESVFTYYGRKTRNEYRLTRFGRDFPFFEEDNVGDLFILAKVSEHNYRGYVLSSDDDIEDFFSAFNISPTETNKLIRTEQAPSPKDRILACFKEYLAKIDLSEFPPTKEIADTARECYLKSDKNGTKLASTKPDDVIISWLEYEFELFKAIENKSYSSIIKEPFKSVEELVSVANTILNRRKSRAGRSLEHHLEKVFSLNKLIFESQAKIEGNKKPDFLFPGTEKYKAAEHADKSLVFLASKTTCKDRWRQILNEADKIPIKHLFTLQQGISFNQLTEMEKAQVQLVVPNKYIASFPKEFQSKIFSLDYFIKFVKSKQA